MRPRSVIFGGIVAGTLAFLCASGAALAQNEPQGDQSQMLEQLGEEPDPTASPPGRAAQLSYTEGSVSLEPAGTSTWTAAVLNRPLTLGDKLWTDRDSRAELDIGDAVIRLGETTGFSFLNLDEQTAQMQVTAGTLIVHVRSLASGEQDEIDTPNLALTLKQPGTYRVEVSDTGDTTIVKVQDGEALATGGGQSYPLAAQQSVTFTGMGTSALAADYATLGAPDSLDDWSMQRDQQAQQQVAVAQEYVSPDTVGADDLGSYGTWESTPDWGYAWFPAVSAGWAPYSLGSWVWISPWGWTWVDAEPWGFAPFHYGRWGYSHRRWCWIPSPRRKHAIYAPALVAWVGGRPHAGGAIGAHVGWFPLGPRDVYVPGYRANPRYVRNINITNSRFVNTADIGKVYDGHFGNVRYVNGRVPGAITAVPRSVFTSARPVGPHRVMLPHEATVNFRPTTAAPAIMPLRQSVLGPNAGRVVRAPPRALVNRPVVARLAPPRAPVSFEREQAAIRANGGRPLPMTELARMRPNVPAAPVRLMSPHAPARGLELRTAPDTRAAPGARMGMSARERVLQQPSLPPARTLHGDRPPWAQARGTQAGSPIGRSRPEGFAPQQRQPMQEWHVPPRRPIAPQEQAPQLRFSAPGRADPEQRFNSPRPQVPGQRFNPSPPQIPSDRLNPPQRQIPAERFNPPQRQIPEQRFRAPDRPVPQQRFTPPPERQMPPQRFAPPPERQMPPQRFAPPPERQMPPQRFTPPAERQIPPQRFTSPGFSSPAMHDRAPSPRAAPARPPGRPAEGRPPSQRPRP
jgi:hypothetical protein